MQWTHQNYGLMLFICLFDMDLLIYFSVTPFAQLHENKKVITVFKNVHLT